MDRKAFEDTAVGMMVDTEVDNRAVDIETALEASCRVVEDTSEEAYVDNIQDNMEPKERGSNLISLITAVA